MIVKTLTAHIYGKLNDHSRHQAVARAVQLGLLLSNHAWKFHSLTTFAILPALNQVPPTLFLLYFRRLTFFSIMKIVNRECLFLMQKNFLNYYANFFF